MLTKEQEEELEKLRSGMEKSAKFAERLPIFKDIIISKKLTGLEDWYSYGENYKGLSLSWGINRGFYSAERSRTITNGPAHEGYLFCIYINSFSLFGNAADLGLKEAAKAMKLEYYDDVNTTFYANDRQIEAVLDALVLWYKAAEHQVNIHQAKRQVIDVASGGEPIDSDIDIHNADFFNKWDHGGTAALDFGVQFENHSFYIQSGLYYGVGR